MALKSLLSTFIGIFILILTAGCAGNGQQKDESRDVYEFSDSTESLKPSRDRIDEGVTYEIYFTLENTVECINVGLETVYLQKKFPVQSVPKKSYFIVDKILESPGISSGKVRIYVPSGKNFDNNWEVHNPVKICGNKNDPVSSLDRSVFRIRFTSFDTLPLHYTVTIYSTVKVIFSTDPEKLKQQAIPVK